MSAAVVWPSRRDFLMLAGATTANYALQQCALADDRTTYPATRTLAVSDLRILADNLSGPEGPTLLHDGRIAFIARPGNVIAVTAEGTSETLASSLGLIVGTALGKNDRQALYICRMDPARLPRRPAGGDSPPAPPPGTATAQSGGPAAAAPSPAAPGAAILRLDLSNRAVTSLYSQCDGHPLAGPNKLVVDEWGDLWITDVFDGALYWARSDGAAIRRLVSPLPGAHGITLSPDRRTVFVSSESELNAFTIKARGTLAMTGDVPAKKLVASLNPEWRVDGIRTLANGNILMACGASLIELSRSGTPVAQTNLPDCRISNFVFGGVAMSTIFATVNAGAGAMPGQGIGRVVSFRWSQAGMISA